MLKVLALLGAGLLTVSAQAQEASNPALIAKTMEAATSCVLAAEKTGANVAVFRKPEWTEDSTNSEFHHGLMPITISFPKDADGVRRICVVQATLASRSDQAQLIKAFEVLLKSNPLQQTDSTIWMFDTKTGSRGLQIYPDQVGAQPKIRLIGAAF